MSDKWDMDAEYPPTLWKNYTPLLRQITADWVRAAGLTCDEKYGLHTLAETIQEYIVASLKHGDRWLRLEEHWVREDKDGTAS